MNSMEIPQLFSRQFPQAPEYSGDPDAPRRLIEEADVPLQLGEICVDINAETTVIHVYQDPANNHAVFRGPDGTLGAFKVNAGVQRVLTQQGRIPRRHHTRPYGTAAAFIVAAEKYDLDNEELPS